MNEKDFEVYNLDGRREYIAKLEKQVSGLRTLISVEESSEEKEKDLTKETKELRRLESELREAKYLYEKEQGAMELVKKPEKAYTKIAKNAKNKEILPTDKNSFYVKEQEEDTHEDEKKMPEGGESQQMDEGVKEIHLKERVKKEAKAFRRAEPTIEPEPMDTQSKVANSESTFDNSEVATMMDKLDRQLKEGQEQYDKEQEMDMYYDPIKRKTVFR